MISTSYALSATGVVMYLGKIMEIGPVEKIYRAPAHQYTKALMPRG